MNDPGSEVYCEEVMMYPKFFLGIFAALAILAIANIIQYQQYQFIALLFVIAILAVLCGRMVITVTEKDVRLCLGYLNIFKYVIPRESIAQAAVISYKPLRNFGGWGIRCGKFEGQTTGCISLKGDRGLLVTLKKPRRVCVANTTRLIIGTQQPEKVKELLGFS